MPVVEAPTDGLVPYSSIVLQQNMPRPGNWRNMIRPQSCERGEYAPRV